MDIARHTRGLLAAAAAALLILSGGVVLSACGDDDDEPAASATAPAAKQRTGNSVDLAFVRDMIPHHRSAVAMAKIAETKGESDFVKGLAKDIIETQNKEISSLQSIGGRLDAAGIKPGDLGVPSHEMGMDADVEMLETAKPFDREFIDMMVPHHQGAIRMARAELAKGGDAESRRLAEAIIKAQTMEITAMNEHRTEAFGSASPEGGVPEDSSSAGESSMEEEGSMEAEHSSGSGSH